MVHKIRGQIALEYAVFTACLIAALLAMRIYVKRSISGRIREAVDNIASAAQAGSFSAVSPFYEPGKTASNITNTLSRQTNVRVQWPLGEEGKKEGHQIIRAVTTTNETTTREGEETIGE